MTIFDKLPGQIWYIMPGSPALGLLIRNIRSQMSQNFAVPGPKTSTEFSLCAQTSDT